MLVDLAKSPFTLKSLSLGNKLYGDPTQNQLGFMKDMIVSASDPADSPNNANR